MHLQKKHVLPTLVQIVGAVALWTLPSVTQADVIIEHLGYSFPQQNGWTQSARSGPDTTEAAVPDDLGYIDSLGLYSDSTGEQSFYRLLAVNEVNRALTEGWALTAIVRIHQCESGGAVVQFGTGSKVYRIDVCSLWTGLALGTGYHVYRLVDANADGSADLFVDGVQVTSNFLGGPWSAGPVVEFGDVVHSYVANAIAYYAQVKFEVDPIELSGGCNDTVVDCNGNGVLDPCEPYIPSLMDCNGNSILDDCEIGGDASLDCNRDGVLDECAMEPDCNANGIPDECDLAEHTSTDCNHNLVLDECDLLCSQGGPDDYVVVAPNTPGGHNNPNTSPVFVFSLQATGPLVSRPNLPGGEVLDPAGVAFDSYGELFVGNRDGNSGPGSISRFKFDGCGNWRFNGQILGNGLEAVHQVAFSPITGELFAVNYWTGTVSRFLFDSQRNAIPNGIIEANAQTGGGGLTVSPNGEVFVSAPDGIHRFLIGENGQATPNGTMPGGACMHFSQQGELLLGSGIICSFDLAGTPTCEPVEGVQGGAAMILTPSNELLISQHGSGGIYRYVMTGPRSAVANGSISTASLFDLAILDLNAIRSRDCNLNATPDECDLAAHASFDCNGNATPDECEDQPVFRIVSSDPPSGTIDARQDRSITGHTTQGFDRLSLTFSCQPSNADSSEPPTPASFAIATTGGLSPVVLAVVSHEFDESSFDIILSDPIPAGQWTTLTANVVSPDGASIDPAANRITLGFLPGDVNGNRTATPSDILDLIDNLNHVRVPALSVWQCDIDRSSLCAPADILRLVDLLNGANTSKSWLGATLPTIP